MENNPNMFPQSNIDNVLRRLRQVLSGEGASSLESILRSSDAFGSGVARFVPFYSGFKNLASKKDLNDKN